MAPPTPIPGVVFGGPIDPPTLPPVLVSSGRPPGPHIYKYCYNWSILSTFCDGTPYYGVPPGSNGDPQFTNTCTPFSPSATYTQDVPIGGPPTGATGPVITVFMPLVAPPPVGSASNGANMYRTVDGGNIFYSMGDGCGAPYGGSCFRGGDATSDHFLTSQGFTPPQDMDNAYYVVSDNRCGESCIPCDGGLRRVSVFLDGVRQFSAMMNAMNQIIIPCSGLLEGLRNNKVTIVVFQSSGQPLAVIPSVQLHRVTYITHDKAVGRNRQETIDPREGINGGGNAGCATCDEALTPGPDSNVPAWLLPLLTTNCYLQSDLDAGDATINAQGYTQQRNSAGEGRGRLYEGYPVPDFSRYIDLVRADCGYGWFPNF